MHKVLILSYYYKPANFVACDRIYSWAKHFKENDIYPIIVTRQWNEGQTDIIDQILNNELTISKNDHHEVHFLPYRNSLRDKIAKSNKYIFLRKTLSFIGLFTDKLFFKISKNYSFYSYAHDLINKNPDIKIVIASGRPFFLFKVASLLSNKNKVKWIADYRDEWTTIYPKQKLSLINKLLFYLDTINERNWIKTSIFFSTTSELIKDRISQKYNKKGVIVFNGYEGNVYQPKQTKKDIIELNILYAGTLYSYQNIELLIESVKENNQNNANVKIYVTYVGVEVIPDQLERLKNYINNDPSFKIIPKLSYPKLIELYGEMDIFYLTSYNRNKGWLPVKIFDYFKMGKPILLYPSDEGTMSDFIEKSNSGVSCRNHDEFKIFIDNLINENINFARNMDFGKLYSRKYQAKVLCDEIKNILQIE